jgi:predicted transcriptional regulator
MSNTKLIQDFINSTSKLYCDDCLASLLKIQPRQQVNQICNKLNKQGLIKRETEKCISCAKGKLVNMCS